MTFFVKEFRISFSLLVQMVRRQTKTRFPKTVRVTEIELSGINFPLGEKMKGGEYNFNASIAKP